ncbi:hypothetical protein D4Q71_21820 [Rhodopseudomonas palustris]|nr:hypothetical protein B1S06_19580 [Rhodopseudomonas palustris]RJF60190.1 hypothetical protein D4Q71_21820 [Rhodopseudomonas palustris]
MLVGVLHQGGYTMGRLDRRDGERLQCNDADERAAPTMALRDLEKENETLKELVVSLSELVMKRVAGQR